MYATIWQNHNFLIIIIIIAGIPLRTNQLSYHLLHDAYFNADTIGFTTFNIHRRKVHVISTAARGSHLIYNAAAHYGACISLTHDQNF